MTDDNNKDKNQNGTLHPAEPAALKEMVDYQDGAIVSRVISKNKAGNVTLFAFDTGQELTEHTSPFDALVLVLDGEARLTIGGEAITAKEGEIVLMPADVSHSLQAPGRFKMMLVMIRGE